MQADLSRVTFDAAKHFSAVLSQQGRVQLDADFNEQAAILLHQLRTTVADLIGAAGAPANAAGFAIKPIPDPDADKAITDLEIGPGRMYVDGILAENENPVRYWKQPDGYLETDADGDRLPQKTPYVVYLRVWERLVTALQDPAIREVALGDPGPDTAARARVVWQVARRDFPNLTFETAPGELKKWLDGLNPSRGLLTARALRPRDVEEKPCDLSPEARFRGPENQLYRVEVHTGGTAWRDSNTKGTFLSGATFKWSRENASVVFPVLSVSDQDIKLATLGRDGKLALEVGDWVELVDDATAARVADDVPLTGPVRAAPPLRRVIAIDAADRLVTVDSPFETDDCGPGTRTDRHPLLRRWDHTSPANYGTRKTEVVSDGALPIVEGDWIDLEDGVQVMFTAPPKPPGAADADAVSRGTYRRGDYWQVPARTITGDVEWPDNPDGSPAARLPHGVDYHYVPLAFVDTAGAAKDLRPKFAAGATPVWPPATPLAPEPAAAPPATSSRSKSRPASRE
ncbi:DUF6519 domain-containing protein [Amycolatopsis sp. NPDC059021]|uniref:DUF6519 domain-containing protein n=1 Tax=Amycolatopsis sp. NPDC059021 TaxID=3346704 RepID=UPI00366CB142